MSNKKLYKKYLLYLLIVSMISLFNIITYSATKIGPGESIKAETAVVPEIAETSPRGFKVDNAQYYDHVEYDEQGRLVDKNRIIIGKGSGNMGEGGGASGKGNSSVDSSGTGEKGTSGNANGQSAGQNAGGQSSSGNNQAGTSRNVVGSSQQRNAELAEEAARQAAASNISNQGTSRNVIKYQDKLKESREAESKRMESIKASQKAAEQALRRQQTSVTMGTVVTKKEVIETETIKYTEDKETLAPQNQNAVGETEKRERETQAKALAIITVPPSTEPQTFEATKKIETTISAPTAKYEETIVQEEKVTEVETVTEEVIPDVKETIIEPIIESVEEEQAKATKEETKNTKVKEIEKETAEETKNNSNDKEALKGDKGEIDHNDEEAAFKIESGGNKKDGKEFAKGETKSGVKIFKIEKKGSIGFKEKKGLNNLLPLLTALTTGFLLSLGILIYYMPYMFHSKKRKKSNYVI